VGRWGVSAQGVNCHTYYTSRTKVQVARITCAGHTRGQHMSQHMQSAHGAQHKGTGCHHVMTSGSAQPCRL
jgi:hypothetical protein